MRLHMRNGEVNRILCAKDSDSSYQQQQIFNALAVFRRSVSKTNVRLRLITANKLLHIYCVCCNSTHGCALM